MSYDMAINIIEDEFRLNDFSKEITFEFFGGEPFLEFETLKKIVECVVHRKWRKPYRFFCTTNGTLIHGSIQDWLIKYKNYITCGLSLDGNAHMHNINRSNSFNNIDLSFFSKYYSYQPIKMTVSQETLPFLFEGVKFCHDNGFKVNANLAYGIDWSNKDFVSMLENQLHQLIDYYLKNNEIEPCSLLNGDIKSISYYNKKNYIPKWCGAGSHMRAYDVNGILYPCHFFMPLTIANCNLNEIRDCLKNTIIPCAQLPIKCRKCCIRSICPTCYGSNYVENGNVFVKDNNYCKLTKIIIKSRAFFLAQKWNLGLLKIPHNDEQMLLHSILLINNELIV